MTTCPECRRKNLDNAKNCEKCGAFLEKVKKAKPASNKPAPKAKAAEPVKVVITDIRIPFSSMVKLLVKWAIASVLAMIIVALLALLLISVAGGLGNLVRIFLKEVLKIDAGCWMFDAGCLMLDV